MSGLVMSLISCILANTDMFVCYPIVEEISNYSEIEQTDNSDKEEELFYRIVVDGFPYESDANKVVNYWYDNGGDLDMIATFIYENGAFDVNKVSKTNDYGLCMLHYNRTNAVWIDDERWGDIMYQAQVCMEKWKAVPDPSKVWYGYKNREIGKKKILFVN